MAGLQVLQLGDKLRELFNKAGGSNFYEHAPLRFEAEGEKGKAKLEEFRKNYISLFQDIAFNCLGKEYTSGIIPPYNKLVIHPADVKVKEAGHIYFFNQWAFQCENMKEYPLIVTNTYDFRKPEYNENKSSVSLRFTYGTLENKTKLFNFFENVIKSSHIPYERQHSGRELDSLDFDMSFEQAERDRRIREFEIEQTKKIEEILKEH